MCFKNENWLLMWLIPIWYFSIHYFILPVPKLNYLVFKLTKWAQAKIDVLVKSNFPVPKIITVFQYLLTSFIQIFPQQNCYSRRVTLGAFVT